MRCPALLLRLHHRKILPQTVSDDDGRQHAVGGNGHAFVVDALALGASPFGCGLEFGLGGIGAAQGGQVAGQTHTLAEFQHLTDLHGWSPRKDQPYQHAESNLFPVQGMVTGRDAGEPVVNRMGCGQTA